MTTDCGHVHRSGHLRLRFLRTRAAAQM